MKMFNYFWNRFRSFSRRSRKYGLTYKPIIKSLMVYYNGLLMEQKKDYNYNKKLNLIEFTFFPRGYVIVEIQGVRIK